jgi:cyclophilin family peptidyl-prolyl cis-trans isomerase
MKLRSSTALLAGLLLSAFTRIHAADAALPEGLYAEFTTPRGAFTAELYFQKAPLMCANFTGLAEGSLAPKDGKPFYTGLTWYRVVPGFVIQSGNPGLKDTDDEKTPIPHRFPDELIPGLRHSAAGVLSMANAGPDTNSCEFFLTLAPTDRLNYLHSVFGQVVRGLDVLAQLKQNDAFTIKILRVGAAAKAFRTDAATFAALSAKAKKYSAAREPGPTAHFDDPGKVLPTEPPRAKNFNYKLANLERVTGLKIVGRMFAKSPTAAEDAQPGAFMRALATKLGTAERGVLVAYFADDDDWRIWFGDELTSRFVGQPGTAQEFTASGAMHEAKEAFLKSAKATGDADFEKQKASLAAAKQPAPPPAQRIKLQTDAILDGLIFKLEPKP